MFLFLLDSIRRHVDFVIEHDEPLPTLHEKPSSPEVDVVNSRIGRNVAALVEVGALLWCPYPCYIWLFLFCLVFSWSCVSLPACGSTLVLPSLLTVFFLLSSPPPRTGPHCKWVLGRFPPLLTTVMEIAHAHTHTLSLSLIHEHIHSHVQHVHTLAQSLLLSFFFSVPFQMQRLLA
jgi:hypothetical protein